MITKQILADYQNIQQELEELRRHLERTKYQDAGEWVIRKEQLAQQLEHQKNEVEFFIARLPTSRQRRLMHLRVLNGMTWNEVACRLSCRDTAGSARTLYYRILKGNEIV